MGSLWSFLSAPKNQKTLSWLAGGLVAVIAGLWAAFFHEPGGGSNSVIANCGSVVQQGSMIGSSNNAGGASDCLPKSK